jgi:hypothetical protein
MSCRHGKMDGCAACDEIEGLKAALAGERERCAAIVLEYARAADSDDLSLDFESCAWAIRGTPE